MLTFVQGQGWHVHHHPHVDDCLQNKGTGARNPNYAIETSF